MHVETPNVTPRGESCATEQTRAIPFLVAFAIAYVGAIAVLHFVTGMSQAAQVLVALAPVPVFALYLHRAIRAMRRLDELEQRIQLEALAIAYPLTLLVLMTLGLLQVVDALAPRYAEFLKIWPVVAWLYVVGVFVARKRYR